MIKARKNEIDNEFNSNFFTHSSIESCKWVQNTFIGVKYKKEFIFLERRMYTKQRHKLDTLKQAHEEQGNIPTGDLEKRKKEKRIRLERSRVKALWFKKKKTKATSEAMFVKNGGYEGALVGG